MRLPSPAIEVPQEKWDIRGLPGSTIFGHSRAIYPPLDLLAIPVLYQDETYALLNLLGTAHSWP